MPLYDNLSLLLLQGILQKNLVSVEQLQDMLAATNLITSEKASLLNELLPTITEPVEVLDAILLCDTLIAITGQPLEPLLRWVQHEELTKTHVYGRFMQWVKLSCVFIGPRMVNQLLQEALDDVERFPTLSSLRPCPQPSNQPSAEEEPALNLSSLELDSTL